MALSVRTITAAEHVAYNSAQPALSFLQTPAWAAVKSEWRHESLGWFDASGQQVGAGLVLYRQLPRLKRYLAYLPEGPVIDWTSPDIGAWLKPLAKHVRRAGGFGLRIGTPVVARRWGAETIKSAIADPTITRLSLATPDSVNRDATRLRNQLRILGWRPPRDEAGFAAGQPRFVFQLPLAGRDEGQLLSMMNQLWRRNIKKAAKVGVEVTQGTAEDLAQFHPLYVETAERDHFTPRPLSYFTAMFEHLLAEDPDRIRIYLAHHEGDLVAATTWVRVGTHAWYSYGASSTAKREVRGSNAIQWRMITDALAAGATVYDLRGITEGLESDDPHLGLIQFKVGTGGEAVEYLGEWDLPLNPLLYKAFDLYMKHR
ncbi:MAG TPA: peptidoglycan bridge formation glycyltransferase FemA/FemB family protein [Propionibacteriaceae bacterium]|nr:peptidoglycan bridge formation glycyltransferase FemA/FemB family protein [Propionibacteriaceae bacterium]